MTLNQTRQLGIEFERRVQTILPATETVAKLDTETIYSFLNQYQQKYVHDIYRGLDKIESGTRLATHVERVLQSMLKSKTLVEFTTDSEYSIDYDNTGITDAGRSKTYTVPEDYQMYVRSVSHVTSTFSWKGNNGSVDVLPNVFTSQADVWKLMETPHNKLRILRYPAAVLSPYNVNGDKEGKTNRPTLTIIHDRYTTIKDVKLLYYKEPVYFDIMTSTPCELPMDCFDDLVTGAVELYIGYVRGGIRQQEEDGRKERAAQRQAEREAEQERRNND